MPQTRCGFARLPGLAFVPPRRLRRRPGLLRTPRPAAPGPLPLRSSAPARRARFARVLRCAPRSPARPRPRWRAPSALAAAVCLRARPRCAAGSLPGRPCCAWAWPLCSASARGGLRLAPPGYARATLRPGPLRGPAGRFFPLRGPGLVVLAGPARLRCGARRVRWASPLPPPPPLRPRWGLRGARGPMGGLRAPGQGPLFGGPLPGSPGAVVGPASRFFGSFDRPKNVNRDFLPCCARQLSHCPRRVKAQAGRALRRGLDPPQGENLPGGLDFPGPARYTVLARPDPLPLAGGRPQGCPWTA